MFRLDAVRSVETLSQIRGSLMYHEYANADGTITRRHYNGRRVTQISAGRNAIDELALAAVKNENSRHWHDRAMDVCRDLSDQIGYEQYCAWIDEQDDGLTWKQLHGLAEAMLLTIDQCNCVGGQSCPGCRPIAAKVYGDLVEV